MTLRQRSFSSLADWVSMRDLVHGDRSNHLHVLDLPYRFSSWAFDDPQNTALWETPDGMLVGWAVMQSPFWSIDYAHHPQAPANLLTIILAWGDQRAYAMQATRFARPIWFVNQFVGHPDDATLIAGGFAPQTDVGEDSWSKVLFERELQVLPQPQPLPDGFSIRSLAGAAEIAAYVALHRAVFQSESMTEAWRACSITHPAYRADLDLVVVDTDGELAGFCIGWLGQADPGQAARGQIEPMGIRADVQGRGLGRAVLGEALRRLAQAGAASVMVETDNYRDAAFGLYTRLDFCVMREVVVYRKEYPRVPAHP